MSLQWRVQRFAMYTGTPSSGLAAAVLAHGVDQQLHDDLFHAQTDYQPVICKRRCLPCEVVLILTNLTLIPTTAHL